MKRLTVFIPFTAFLLLGAHFLRQGAMGLAAACLVLGGLLFTRAGWMRWVGAAALLAGALVWADSAVGFIRFRQALGADWTRLAIVMVGVVALDLIGAGLLCSRLGEDWFHRGAETAAPRAAMFLLTVAGLAVARAKAPFAVLLADRYFPGWGWLEMVLLGVYAAWIGDRMLAPGGHRALRPRIWALFSAVFFLQLVLGLLGMDRMLMTGTLHLPVPALIAGGPIFRGGGYFMVVLFTVTVLLAGPAWCSHLCYIGAWDDRMSRLGPRPAPNVRLGRFTVFGRLGTLVLVAVTALGLRLVGVPAMAAALLGAAFGLVGVGIMVVLSRRAGLMVHCTAYCPMGLAAGLLGKVSLWRMRIHEDCTRCGACFSVCRYNALDGDRLAKGGPGVSCTLCGDCVSACAHGCIQYHFPGLRPAVARTLFLVVVVSLHALFLGVARI